MSNRMRTFAGAIALGAALALAGQAGAAASHNHAAGQDHAAHDHAGHDHGTDEQIYKGYFEDDQIKDRTLADWQGEWQSVYPLLRDGTLDQVMEKKAEKGDKSAAEYRAYYETGYRTVVDAITIDGDTVTFSRAGHDTRGRYAGDGREVLTYEKGNRGVRFVFKKVSGDAAAPDFIQFSDHRIAPASSDHLHLYWGDDRTALLSELTNWPTYYPAAMSGEEIAREMAAH
jgi:Predicted periplasmic or secreted protein